MGLKTVKDIKFKSNPLSCSRRKQEMPGLYKKKKERGKENSNQFQGYFSSPSVDWVFYIIRPFYLFCFISIYTYHLLHFRYAFIALHMPCAFSSTSELQVPTTLMDLSTNKVCKTGHSIPSTEFSPQSYKPHFFHFCCSD